MTEAARLLIPADQLEIRSATMDDLQLLEQQLPVEGMPNFSRLMLGFQAKDLSTYLMASLDGEPVSHLQIYWRGSTHELVREAFKPFPMLVTIETRPDMRSRGIGRALIGAAENVVYNREFDWVGLTVEENNMRAARLYEELGYRYWAHPPLDTSYDPRDYGGTDPPIKSMVKLMFKYVGD